MNGCVGDVEKIEQYLDSIESDQFELMEKRILTDEMAKKEVIAKSIIEIIQLLEDGDTFLLYFSGHGTQEISKGIFKEDHNGTLEAIVCHFEFKKEKDPKANYILADKEIRYLLNQCKVKAHIVGVFDCCHSGDIIKSFLRIQQAKRLSRKSPQRSYENFLFHKEVPIKDFQTNWFDEIFPDANITTISACQSFELSWEDTLGGVFTRNLLTVLSNSNSVINYNDLVKKTELAIRNTTLLKQTPTINIQGESIYNQLTSWLQLNGTSLKDGAGYIKFNISDGWIYSKGKILGVQAGDTIRVRIASQDEIPLTIQQINLNDSIVEVANLSLLDTAKIYSVVETITYPKPSIFLEDLDSEPVYYATIKKLVEIDPTIEWTTQRENADFQINIFNQCIYFSLINDPYRPLQRQLDLLQFGNESLLNNALQNLITEGSEIISRWSFYKNLEQHHDFTTFPVRIEVSKDQTENWIDITNGANSFKEINPTGPFKLLASPIFNIRITNLTDEKLFVTPICLFLSRLEISAGNFFDNRSEVLEGGSSKIFPNKRIWLEDYQEIYNWRAERVYLKFMVSTHADLTTTLPAITQSGFLAPLTHLDFRNTVLGGDIKGGGGASDLQVVEKWGVYSAELTLPNTYFNQISGRLKGNIDEYKSNDLLSPFIDRLYFDLPSSELTNRLIVKENSSLYEDRVSPVWLSNLIDVGRINRRFEVLKKKFPNKKVIIAEGDSWFLYPIRIKDTLDYIMEEWPVKSMAWRGHALKHYTKPNDFLQAVQEEAGKQKPFYVLLSGGGNLLIGPGLKRLLQQDLKNAAHPKDYLTSSYKNQMNELKNIYQYLFSTLSEVKFVEKILVHGYDYIQIEKENINGGWVNFIMEGAGIKDAIEKEKLIRYLIDEFNKGLASLAARYPKVTYIDVRGCIGENEWYDEVHPDERGFRKIANKFLAELTSDSIVLL